MLKVLSFHIFSPLREEREEKNTPSVQMEVEKEMASCGGLSLCPESPEAVCCSLVSYQDRLGHSNQMLQTHSPPGLGVLNRGAGDCSLPS